MRREEPSQPTVEIVSVVNRSSLFPAQQVPSKKDAVVEAPLLNKLITVAEEKSEVQHMMLKAAHGAERLIRDTVLGMIIVPVGSILFISIIASLPATAPLALPLVFGLTIAGAAIGLTNRAIKLYEGTGENPPDSIALDMMKFSMDFTLLFSTMAMPATILGLGVIAGFMPISLSFMASSIIVIAVAAIVTLCLMRHPKACELGGYSLIARVKHWFNEQVQAWAADDDAINHLSSAEENIVESAEPKSNLCAP
ncbi:MAG: hypothetical protein GKR77_04945 [Legionellales bacterium]|nr:hypothetical protein [Legionellales bacterium]